MYNYSEINEKLKIKICVIIVRLISLCKLINEENLFYRYILIMSETAENSKDTKDTNLFKVYPVEFVEAFITIIVIRAILDKPIEIGYIFRTAAVLAGVMFIATTFNSGFKTNIREGFRNSLGYFIFAQFAR